MKELKGYALAKTLYGNASIACETDMEKPTGSLKQPWSYAMRMEFRMAQSAHTRILPRANRLKWLNVNSARWQKPCGILLKHLVVLSTTDRF
jgi:hypothetical protein